jgi:hypothetical protein
MSFIQLLTLKDLNLEELLSEWEFYYNWHRPHSSLNGKTPRKKHLELLYQTPLWEEVGNMYNPEKERIISQNYQAASQLKMLKQSL